MNMASWNGEKKLDVYRLQKNQINENFAVCMNGHMEQSMIKLDHIIINEV